MTLFLGAFEHYIIMLEAVNRSLSLFLSLPAHLPSLPVSATGSNPLWLIAWIGGLFLFYLLRDTVKERERGREIWMDTPKAHLSSGTTESSPVPEAERQFEWSRAETRSEIRDAFHVSVTQVLSDSRCSIPLRITFLWLCLQWEPDGAGSRDTAWHDVELHWWE